MNIFIPACMYKTDFLLPLHTITHETRTYLHVLLSNVDGAQRTSHSCQDSELEYISLSQPLVGHHSGRRKYLSVDIV